jgi:asparagine synthase (glutamine-hydrolysing)
MRQVKPMLARAMRPVLPESVWTRPKRGFGVPLGLWFKGELGTMFADEVLASGARSDAVRTLWDQHRRDEEDHGAALWTMLTLERWLRSVEVPCAVPVS